MKKIIFDLDGTLTQGNNNDYLSVLPRLDVVSQLINFKNQGYEIIICTARNMRTYNGNIGKINKNTLPIIIAWLDKHQIPYDELIVGKPWCGEEGFYVDDRALRPSEFANMKNIEDVYMLLDEEKRCS